MVSTLFSKYATILLMNGSKIVTGWQRKLAKGQIVCTSIKNVIKKNKKKYLSYFYLGSPKVANNLKVRCRLVSVLICLLKLYSKFKDSMLKGFEVINTFTSQFSPVLVQCFSSLTQAVTSQAENCKHLKNALIE